MSHSQLLLTSPQPLSRLANLLNGADRKVHITQEWIEKELTGGHTDALELVQTNHGKRLLFTKSAIDSGFGLNVLVKNSLTPYFTPLLFFKLDEQINPEVV